MRVEQGRNTLKDLVNDPSDACDGICFLLDTPVAGLGNYADVAKYYDHSVFTVKSRFERPSPSKELILSIIAGHPHVTVEAFAEVVEDRARRKDVARLLREFDLKDD